MGTVVNSGCCDGKFCRDDFREFLELTKDNTIRTTSENDGDSTYYNIEDIKNLVNNTKNMSKGLKKQLKACIKDGYMCID